MGDGYSTLAIEVLFVNKHKMTSPWQNNIITDAEPYTVPSLKCAKLFLTVMTTVIAPPWKYILR